MTLFEHEPLVNGTWAQLRRSGILPDGLSRLRQQLDAPAGDSFTPPALAAREALLKVATESISSLRRRNPSEALPTTRQLLASLLLVLARRPVRRFIIYDIWVRSWIARNASKAAGGSGGGFAPRQVVVEAAAVSRALAVAMTCENVSRVEATQTGSRLEARLTEGSVASPFSPFLTDDELLKVAKAAAPIQSRGGVLCFIHKTIQEFETASGVLASINKAFSAIPAQPHVLSALIVKLEMQATSPSTASGPVATGGGGTAAAGRHGGGGTRGELHPILQSTAARPVRRLLLLFAESALAQMRLVIEHKVVEEQVIDFLVDAL